MWPLKKTTGRSRTTRKKKSRYIRLLISLAVAFLLAGGGELWDNHNYFRLSEAEKGIQEIGMDQISGEGFEKTQQGIMKQGTNTNIRIELQGRYVGKFCYTYRYDALLKAQIRYQYHNSLGTTEWESVSDKNSAVINTSVININRNVDWIEIQTGDVSLSEGGLGLDGSGAQPEWTSFCIKNEFNWNWHRFAAVFLLGAMGVLLVIFREFWGRRVELAFLMVSIVVGTLLISCMPASKVGWDEEAHFARAYSLSCWPADGTVSEGFYNHFLCGITTWPLNLPETAEEQAQVREYQNRECQTFGDMPVEGQILNTYSSGYAASALALRIGRGLHFDFSILFQFGRLANLFVYAAAMCLAIYFLPVGKRLLLIIGLMPTSMFLACCYSYDATVIAFTSLGLSLWMKNIYEENKIGWLEYLIALGCLFVGILPKAVYAPLVLIGLIIPVERFKNKKQMWIMKSGICLLFLLLMASFVLPSLIATSSYGDVRGGAVDTPSQMSYVLSHPFGYIMILFKNITRNLTSFLGGTEVFCRMGHWGNMAIGNIVLLHAAGNAVLTGTDDNSPVVTWKQKLVFAILAGASIVLVWTAMYLSFTVPGSSLIRGVQGRYYIPVLLLVYLLFRNNTLKIRWTEEKLNLAALGVSLGILTIMLWKYSLVRYCL